MGISSNGGSALASLSAANANFVPLSLDEKCIGSRIVNST
jgi:hypothetical protein